MTQEPNAKSAPTPGSACPDMLTGWRFVAMNDEAEAWEAIASDTTFLGQRIDGMSRRELLAVIGAMTEERSHYLEWINRYGRMIVAASKSEPAT